MDVRYKTIFYVPSSYCYYYNNNGLCSVDVLHTTKNVVLLILPMNRAPLTHINVFFFLFFCYSYRTEKRKRRRQKCASRRCTYVRLRISYPYPRSLPPRRPTTPLPPAAQPPCRFIFVICSRFGGNRFGGGGGGCTARESTTEYRGRWLHNTKS